jgi:hypothetical protein
MFFLLTLKTPLLPVQPGARGLAGVSGDPRPRLKRKHFQRDPLFKGQF